MICGIDYGSKMAGTTSICFLRERELIFKRSSKKEDADQMILEFCEMYEPELIAIDAPLSLPGVYRGLDGFDNYFYRHCDSELRAMSPMFLGGLTARAMKLKSQLSGVKFIEAYPVAYARKVGLEKWGYRKESPDYIEMVKSLKVDLKVEILTTHDFDALLCHQIAINFLNQAAEVVGDQSEGLIYY